MMKRVLLLLPIALVGCTTADRNAVAVALCDRTAGCTVTTDKPTYGPPQVAIMEEPRKKTSRTTQK